MHHAEYIFLISRPSLSKPIYKITKFTKIELQISNGVKNDSMHDPIKNYHIYIYYICYLYIRRSTVCEDFEQTAICLAHIFSYYLLLSIISASFSFFIAYNNTTQHNTTQYIVLADFLPELFYQFFVDATFCRSPIALQRNKERKKERMLIADKWGMKVKKTESVALAQEQDL